MTKKSKAITVAVVLIIIVATAGITMKLLNKDGTSTQTKDTVNTSSADVSSTKSGSEYAEAKIYKVGETANFQSVSLKVNSSKTTKTTSSSYGSPIFAEQGTKFVIINLTVTNTTQNSFIYNPFVLVDQKDRTYSSYENTIGNLDDYLDGATLSPSVPKTGMAMYQIPEDSKTLRLGGQIGNSGKAQFVQFEVE